MGLCKKVAEFELARCNLREVERKRAHNLMKVMSRELEDEKDGDSIELLYTIFMSINPVTCCDEGLLHQALANDSSSSYSSLILRLY